jgi:hypothetical protein
MVRTHSPMTYSINSRYTVIGPCIFWKVLVICLILVDREKCSLSNCVFSFSFKSGKYPRSKRGGSDPDEIRHGYDRIYRSDHLPWIMVQNSIKHEEDATVSSFIEFCTIACHFLKKN